MQQHKSTRDMTAIELAKVVAAEYGYRGGAGGRIYTPDGKAVCHGWLAFAGHLAANGFVREGQGIAWTRIAWAGGPSASSLRAQVALARVRATRTHV